MNIDIFKHRHAARRAGLVATIVVALQYSPSGFAAVNPYETITTRNVFGINPPAPPAPVEQPKPRAPEIKLQGITTILGNKLVLFKATIPAKPPEQPAPKLSSFMLSEGQREGEIEVLEINEVTGVVKFRNFGVEETLNLKENADKPVATGLPNPAIPGVPPVGGAGVIPAPVVPAAGATPQGGSSVTTFGTDNRTRSIPTRTPRTGNSQGSGPAAGIYPGAGASQTAQQNNLSQEVHNMSPEVQTILIEANRASAKTPQEAAMLPITPVTPHGQPNSAP